MNKSIKDNWRKKKKELREKVRSETLKEVEKQFNKYKTSLGLDVGFIVWLKKELDKNE